MLLVRLLCLCLCLLVLLLQHIVAAIFDILDPPSPYLDQFAIYICLHAGRTVLVIEIENHQLNQLELSEDFGIF